MVTSSSAETGWMACSKGDGLACVLGNIVNGKEYAEKYEENEDEDEEE
jgi:hypothetical protein